MSTVPGAAAAGTFTTNVKEADPPTPSTSSVHVTEPPLPTAGVEHPKGGPLFSVSETKVVDAGSVSLNVIPVPSSGPLLLTVSVYVMLPPGVTDAGPVLFTAMSASGMMTPVPGGAVTVGIMTVGAVSLGDPPPPFGRVSTGDVPPPPGVAPLPPVDRAAAEPPADGLGERRATQQVPRASRSAAKSTST
ncbi:MAG TPA: hypothetical protein VKH36_01555 [Acidimicrobiia bacterium]|nr:hypothetical protein [Acidimicrobiia bacterium]